MTSSAHPLRQPDQQSVKNYALVTFNYWSFTLTDGALRMLVVLHFYQLGYSGLEIALLFLLYEFFGVVTNLTGGWLGARIGLNRTMNLGLALQIGALLMMAIPQAFLSVPLVMIAQAISGTAKDLNKMSAKSAIKSLVKSHQQGRLFRWVALLTGSKNALKGVGFFLGGTLLGLIGFQNAMVSMATVLAIILFFSLCFLKNDLGKAQRKPVFHEILSNSRSVNVLSAARLFLFGSRDIWFVVALPLTLASVFGWSHSQTGAFMAFWVIGYGLVQGITPNLMPRKNRHNTPVKPVFYWGLILLLVSGLLALLISLSWFPEHSLLAGLLVFGVVFAINSSLHSFLIVHYARKDGASLDVGFYYTANAMGRLVGTVISGSAFQWGGLEACLWLSALFVLVSTAITLFLPGADEPLPD